MFVMRLSPSIRVPLAGSQLLPKQVLVLRIERREHHDSLLSVLQSFEPHWGEFVPDKLLA